MMLGMKAIIALTRQLQITLTREVIYYRALLAATNLR